MRRSCLYIDTNACYYVGIMLIHCLTTHDEPPGHAVRTLGVFCLLTAVHLPLSDETHMTVSFHSALDLFMVIDEPLYTKGILKPLYLHYILRVKHMPFCTNFKH